MQIPVNKQNAWRPGELLESRQIDILDVDVAVMGRTIKRMRTDEVPFSRYVYEALVAEYKKCAALNYSLTTEQRVWAIEARSLPSFDKDFLFLLYDASRQRN